ncbi:alpha beta-hydrolase [Fusarium albosuccineum]|uniref:Alpha beta-hydrolase n=1 Tax=Fusarium albosuccineum TaxID=1237068 RepID=A0A8H4LD74_9HYPO|nr:alpha beta-hydrolase [Fusarium albosuccineum]
MFLNTAISPLLLLLSSSLAEALPYGDGHDANVDSLDWKPCDLEFPDTVKAAIKVPIDCATLQVPLDYTNPKSGKLDLQLLKVNATKEPVEGSVIFNPGGPGNSGVEEVAQQGPLYRDTLGGHYNIIGFDARGTGRTIPFICNPELLASGLGSDSGALSRRNSPYSALPEQLDVYELLKKNWNTTAKYIETCVETQKENATFYGTAFVARDMLAIVDALKEDGLLRFWGRSYSTILGQTFAAMFPDRVGRLLMDSTLTPDDYYRGGWLSATRDVEATLSNYFNQCIEAGPTLCPLANYSGSDTTSKSLMNALSEVFEYLRENPILLAEEIQAIQPEWWFPPGSMTVYYKLKASIMNGIFSPAAFGGVTKTISDALARNWTTYTDPSTIPDIPGAENVSLADLTWSIGLDRFHGIACGDQAYRAKSPEEMYSLIQAQSAQGSFSDAFSPKVWVCAQWPFDAAEKPKGNWSEITTNFPVLFINSRFDPITPLSGAWDASSRFKGSRLLVHEGHGHGIMNHRSNCTVKAIEDYFSKGELPEVGTTCKPNMNAFKQIAAGEGSGRDSESPE